LKFDIFYIFRKFDILETFDLIVGIQGGVNDHAPYSHNSYWISPDVCGHL